VRTSGLRSNERPWWSWRVTDRYCGFLDLDLDRDFDLEDDLHVERELNNSYTDRIFHFEVDFDLGSDAAINGIGDDLECDFDLDDELQDLGLYNDVLTGSLSIN